MQCDMPKGLAAPTCCEQSVRKSCVYFGMAVMVFCRWRLRLLDFAVLRTRGRRSAAKHSFSQEEMTCCVLLRTNLRRDLDNDMMASALQHHSSTQPENKFGWSVHAQPSSPAAVVELGRSESALRENLAGQKVNDHAGQGHFNFVPPRARGFLSWPPRRVGLSRAMSLP